MSADIPTPVFGEFSTTCWRVARDLSETISAANKVVGYRTALMLSETATCRQIPCPTISGLRGSRHGARCSSLLRLPVGHMPASDTPASCSQHRVPLPNIMACHRPHRCALHAASSMRTNCSDREQECDQQFLEIHAFYPKGCHSNESAPLHIAVKPALAHPGLPKHHQDSHERGADKQA
jgi:hypothetical protein